ncbi:MAG: UvrD-helicase domain-containing protein [Chloroflexi bacterium]|nr:UvrD-helicase domain-containing protein [Chloroflexota bacterium]
MTLADQQDRDRIANNLDETLFVEAGAGTGKTEALVGRIVNLIASGDVGAHEIAAITFTEKAAAELYDRVLERLDQRREAETDPAQQRLFAEAAEQLDHAAIETLHAFAARILRMYPIEAGLPPGFQIVDESDALLRFTERWEEELDLLLEDDDLAEPLLAAFDAGLELKHLRDLAWALHTDWDRAAADAAELPFPELSQRVAEISAPLREITAFRRECSDPEDKLAVNLEQIERILDRVRQSADADPSGEMLRQFLAGSEFKVGPGRGGSGKNWGGTERVKEIKDAIRLLADVPARLAAAALEPVLVPIHNELRRFVVEYSEERRREGRLEFQDLLVRASTLLELDKSTATLLRDRFKRLLIDEFQDNDPLQTRIIDAIAQGEAGRAFYVGDPKQSIYRFRRADIQQFNQVKRQQAAGLTRLSQNFRSTPGVTEFVNAVFQPLMLDGGEGQAEWDDLNAHREVMEGVEHTVTVVGDQLEGPINATRRAEADTLVRMIADVTASHTQVFDKGRNCTRDAHFADIAVLVPTRTGLTHLLPALEERDIPYRLESRSLVYHTREIRDLLNLLRAIDDPTDQIALVAALKSPAFACPDDALYRWRQARGQWDYRQPAPAAIPTDDPVADSLAWLRDAAARRWEMTVSELVGHAIRDRRLMELAVIERQPREHWARYRFLHDQARAFCDRGGSTLSEFLAWAQHQAEADTRVIESVVPEEDHDAVRIMTIHAAKGLEFPIVVFTGLNSAPRNDAPTLLWDVGGRPEIQFRKGLATPGFTHLWLQEQQMQADEYVRRNYVGATRARDHLILSLYRGTRKSDAELIDAVLETAVAPYRRLTEEEIPNPPIVERVAEPDNGSGSAVDREAWIERREELIKQMTSLPRESATGVAKRAAGYASEPPERGADRNFEPDDDLPPWRRGRAGTAIGRATHGALQVVDLKHPDDNEIRNAARAQAAAESLGTQASAEVERLTVWAASSDTVREAVSEDRYWRELYAAVEIDGVLLDGFVDLLYELPNGNLVVVDYKTDALRAGEVLDAAVSRYRLQAASYALMLEESLQRTVERCVLLFLHPQVAREISDLRGALGEVRSLLKSED